MCFPLPSFHIFFFSDLILPACLHNVSWICSFFAFFFFYLYPSYFTFTIPWHLPQSYSPVSPLFCIILCFVLSVELPEASKVPCTICLRSLLFSTIPSLQWITGCTSIFIFALLLTCLPLQPYGAPFLRDTR